ncbi:MAG: hypothetical protein LBP19_05150 [Treponema sp.]|jgi:hypothetical protein|nr:hypothetical protein [Treponema sp.]
MYEGRGGEAAERSRTATKRVRGDEARRDEGAEIPLAGRLCMKGGEGRWRNARGAQRSGLRGDEEGAEYHSRSGYV